MQYISITKYSNILCISTFFKINNWIYKFIFESSLYADYFLKVLTAVCMDALHYTSANVILLFYVQDIIMKILMKKKCMCI